MVKLELISREGREQARVSVMDQGPGIPEELQPRLFEKFQQAHNKTNARQKGSGLGLALARQIIEAHHGEIGVESEPDKGSEFFFLLPVKAKD
jgi:signal transduction histidine kinase